MYEETQIKEILKKPKRAVEIAKAKKTDSLLRVFTEFKTKEEALNEVGFREFIKFIESNFKKERADKIKNYFLFPLSAVDITESILKDLYKVFDARNSFFDYKIDQKNGNEELKNIISEINPVKWITQYGKKVLKNQPNLIVVIDKDNNGKPYLLPINSSRLIDCDVNDDGTLNYVAFVHSIEKKDDEEIKRVSFYDEKKYYVFIEEDGEYSLDEELTNEHEAEVCPARMFLKDQLNSTDFFSRRIPFSSSLSKLMEWQYFDVYKFYVDHYASFPVIERVEDDCDVQGCEGGLIRYEEEYFEEGETLMRTQFKECPSCSKSDVIGPGLVVNLPAKQTKDDPDSAGVFRMISPETKNLEYLQDKLDRIETTVKLKTVGIDNIITKEAINEKQAQGSFESKQNVLLSIKDNLDELYKWIIVTTSKLVIGSNVDIKVNANFGTEFYLLTEEELQKKYETGKKAGLPVEELSLIYEQIIATKYKGNPSKLGRLEIISLLDPLPHENIDEAIKKYKLGLLTDDEIYMKARLMYLVQRFELEQAPLTEFGRELETPQRIAKIKEILNKYINENNEAKSIRENFAENQNSES